MMAIHMSHVSKSFPVDDTSVMVLGDINIDIHLGELTMLIGPSGCGKTTLISIISGILSASGGVVEVLGHNIIALNDLQKVLFRRNNIGFIFQQYNLLPALTAAENAALPLIAAGINISDAIKKSIALLEKMNMQKHVHKLPRQLSGGQQQRVAIARSFVHSPRIIICDEPTAALDARTGDDVMRILRDIANDAERCVLIVSHDSRIYHYADRIIEMTDGAIIADQSAQHYLGGNK